MVVWVGASLQQLSSFLIRACPALNSLLSTFQLDSHREIISSQQYLSNLTKHQQPNIERLLFIRHMFTSMNKIRLIIYHHSTNQQFSGKIIWFMNLSGFFLREKKI